MSKMLYNIKTKKLGQRPLKCNLKGLIIVLKYEYICTCPMPGTQTKIFDCIKSKAWFCYPYNNLYSPALM